MSNKQKFFIVLVGLIIAAVALAHAQPSGYTPEKVPIDTFIFGLILIGVAIGLKTIWKHERIKRNIKAHDKWMKEIASQYEKDQ